MQRLLQPLRSLKHRIHVASKHGSRARRTLRKWSWATYGIRVAGLRTRTIRGYWWDEVPNFGDLLTPLLLPHYGVVPIRHHPDQARLAGVGSVLEHFDESFSGIIWGSGSILGDPIGFPQARVLGVRGRLTQELLGAPDSIALGDPGLLIREVVPAREPAYDAVFVPHYLHRGDAFFTRMAAEWPGRTAVVDVAWHPRRVARMIARARCVVSSSLHGMILADSYRIPTVRIVSREDPLYGHDFKFRDHESVVKPPRMREVVADATVSWQEVERAATAADHDAVNAAVAELERSARLIYDSLARR